MTDCNWFTFNPAGSSSESDRCDAYFDCPDLDESCLDCVSGEACDCDCGQLPDDEHALTKFLIGLGRDTLYDVEVADLPSAYEDSSSDDHTVCEKPTDYPLFLETAVAALLGTLSRCMSRWFNSEVSDSVRMMRILKHRWQNFFLLLNFHQNPFFLVTIKCIPLKGERSAKGYLPFCDLPNL